MTKCQCSDYALLCLSFFLRQALSSWTKAWPPTGPSLHGLHHLLSQEGKLPFLTVSAKALMSSALGGRKVPTTANEPYELMKGKFFCFDFCVFIVIKLIIFKLKFN